MLHPLFSLLVRRPDLVVEHVSGYAALAHEEAAQAAAELLERLIAGALAVVFAVVFLTLAGTAVMLAVMFGQVHWVLLVLPAAVLVLLVFALAKVRKPLATQRFSELKAQVQRDAHALRAAA
ncbi:MAG: hypothetical protein Q8M51_00980 [Polaromonas sp.]|uniref:hypothetical protein n=1 Tax=Polaromonas sp. TaxID=1869339 RepID=UPI0027319C2B|nr:hypothetical protein [Polaromonas sp.]MDP1740245.1 hypothetical protein [Polaromonas sp.]MDP1955410.1 hypothetical protein [Polaromonas sp.]MDP3354422.1 hypothetical protein [Polaromonas sp.]MDP3751351.1 hypothetical protein [Polaromonas sp.]